MVMTVMVMVMVIMYDSVAMSSCSWVKMPNTNVLSGIADGADTYTECQAACVNNVECTGVDWNGAASPGQRCWLAGPWSGKWRIGIVPDITHYNLTRYPGCGNKMMLCSVCISKEINWVPTDMESPVILLVVGTMVCTGRIV